MPDVTITSSSTVKTTTGGTVSVAPASKTLASITEVYDKTLSIAAGATSRLWENTGVALGYPANWESAQFVIETAGKECRLTITNDAGSPTTLSFLCNDKFPFNLAQMNMGTATSATGDKVGLLQATNPEATAIVVRLVLYGPEV